MHDPKENHLHGTLRLTSSHVHFEMNLAIISPV